MPSHDFNQFFRSRVSQSVARHINDVIAQMILEQLNDETVGRPPDRGGKVEDLGTGCLGLQRAFDGLHLAFQAADSGEEL